MAPSDTPTSASAATSDGPTSEKVLEMAREMRTCMLATVTAEGELHSRPMAVQQVDDDGTMWFFFERSSRKAAELALDSRVNAGFATATAWLSIAGTGSIVDDAALKKALWNTWVEAWFPNGETDPDVTFLKVSGSSAEYWDSPGGGRLATLVSLVKSKVTGERMEGDNESTDLS